MFKFNVYKYTSLRFFGDKVLHPQFFDSKQIVTTHQETHILN